MPGHNDFWDNLITGAYLDDGGSGSIDSFLSGKPIGGEPFNSVRGLTDSHRAFLALPVEAGARVAFLGNMGAVLTYADAPANKAQGTVVTVKSANGDLTEHCGKVFVQWDDGKFRPIFAEHLRLAEGPKTQAKTGHHVIRVASLAKLAGEYQRVANNTLIHRSTRDLWSFRRDGQEYILERMFDDQGGPLKG